MSKYEESINIEENFFNIKDKILESYEKLQQIQDFYRQKWSNFNIIYCIIGIGSFILTLLIMLALIFYMKSYDKYHLNFQVTFNAIKFNMVAILMFFFIIQAVGFNIEILSSSYIIAFIFYVYLFNMKIFIYIRNISLPSKNTVIYFLTLLIPFSNSFVIKENICLRFCLIAIILLSCGKLSTVKEYVKLIFALILCRMSEIFYVCREEIQDTCKRYSFSMSITKIVLEQTNHLIFYLILSIIVVNATYFIFLDNKVKSPAIKRLLRIQLILQIFYWLLQLKNIKIAGFNLIIILPRIYYLLFLFQIILLFYKMKKFEAKSFIAILFQLLVILLGENRCISICILILIMNILVNMIKNDKGWLICWLTK